MDRAETENATEISCPHPSKVHVFIVESLTSPESCLLTVVNQFYEAEILTEYVIRGNAAVLKCSIPSFVADFVKVEAWIDEEGTVIAHTGDLGNNG